MIVCQKREVTMIDYMYCMTAVSRSKTLNSKSVNCFAKACSAEQSNVSTLEWTFYFFCAQCRQCSSNEMAISKVCKLVFNIAHQQCNGKKCNAILQAILIVTHLQLCKGLVYTVHVWPWPNPMDKLWWNIFSIVQLFYSMLLLTLQTDIYMCIVYFFPLKVPLFNYFLSSCGLSCHYHTPSVILKCFRVILDKLSTTSQSDDR